MKASPLRIFLVVIIIVGFGAGFYFLPIQDTSTEQIEIEIQQVELQEIEELQQISEQVFEEPLSIVTTEVVFTPSSQNDYQKYLDEEKPLGKTATPQFTLETSASLVSPTGDLVSSNKFLDIPLAPALLTDEQGNVLIDSAQIGFFGKTTENAELKAEGTAEFWLDDKLVTTKKIFFTPDGIPKTTHRLFLDDMIKSTIINQVPTAFTYKFTDEPFVDLSTHTFRVIIKDFTAETIKQTERKKYSWSGEFLAYQLQMYVDKSKISILTEDGKPISVFKDDNRLIVCDVWSVSKGDYNTHDSAPFPTKNKVPPITVIRESDNQVVAVVDITKSQSTQNIIYEDNCAIFDKLQRSTKYIFLMEGKSYQIQTPTIQQNYYASCSSLVRFVSAGYTTGTHHYIGDKCVSTFAKDWEFIYDDRENKIIRINSILLQVCGTETTSFITRILQAGFGTASANYGGASSPIVELFDGSTKLGQIGGKTYCTVIDNLPKGKPLTIKVQKFTETGVLLDSSRTCNGTCPPIILKQPFDEGIFTVTTPTDKQFIYELSCGSVHSGWVLGRAYYLNDNIGKPYQTAGSNVICSSNFGYQRG